MSEKNADEWLNEQPADPDDPPRRVHLERMITGRKRTMWLFQFLKQAPLGAGVVIVIWQLIHFVAERFPEP